MSGLILHVRRHPTDWQTATYRIEDANGFRWDSVSGGVARNTSRETLFAYVDCDKMLSGELAHSCQHGPPPHRIKVAVVKKLTDPAAFAFAKAAADQIRATQRLKAAIAANFERSNAPAE
jgi:hypothetical protein